MRSKAPPLDLLPLAIEGIEAGGHFRHFRRIVAGQQARAQVGFPHRPPALIRGPITKPKSCS